MTEQPTSTHDGDTVLDASVLDASVQDADPEPEAVTTSEIPSVSDDTIPPASEEAADPADPQQVSDAAQDSAVEVPQPQPDSGWRYHLDVLVGEAAGSQVWQATDPVLGRKVGVRLLPSDDARADDLREAAYLAARITDRRVIHVLDVVDVRFESRPHVAIVTEWIDGQPLHEQLTSPWGSARSLALAAEVAECLAGAHQAGIAHGRLRPSSVLLTEAGDVRVRGIGVEAVLRGCDPDPVPATSDIQAVGGILYAASTGRWPYGEVDELPAAPEIGGRVPLPSRVVPGVSPVVDSMCAAAVRDCGDGPGVTRMTALASSLRSSATALREEDGPPPAPGAEAPAGGTGRRAVAVGAAALGVVALAIAGWQLVASGPSAVTPRAIVTSAPPSASASGSPARIERALPIVAASDFDPLGNGRENPDQAGLAIDGDTATAWTTSTYNEDNLSGKDGVGLLLDLGAPRSITAVQLALVGAGTNVQVRTADQKSENPEDYALFAKASAAPRDITMRRPSSVSARYVLIWLTRLPGTTQGTFQGGVASARVLG